MRLRRCWVATRSRASPGAPVPPIPPPQDGFLFLDREQFAASFAADVPARQAAFMADSQVPWGVEALNGQIREPAWASKPSWYLVATDDRMIPPPAQRKMAERARATVAEQPGSHSTYISQPRAVAALISQAVRIHRPAVPALQPRESPGKRPGRCHRRWPAGRPCVLPATPASPRASTGVYSPGR
jgi:pimeloyl-ACP methyl ester carboxylesterase